MKKLIYLLLAAVALTAISCTRIGDDPEKDGRNMMTQYLALLKDGETDKANKTLSKYIEVYKDKPLKDQATFFKASTGAVWDNMREYSISEWAKLSEKIEPALEQLKELGNSFDAAPAENE